MGTTHHTNAVNIKVGSAHPTVISDSEAAQLWATFLSQDDPRGFAAFDRLYTAFLPMVLRYCRFRLGDAHRGEDVANAVFVRLLDKKPTIRSSFIGLLLRTARRMCDSEKVKPKAGQLMTDPPRQDATDHIEQREQSTALAECLSRLGEQDRMLVVLRFGEGLSYRQIREVMEEKLALSTFTRRVKRILPKLRQCLKEKKVF